MCIDFPFNPFPLLIILEMIRISGAPV
jgi:hypothetical protein